MNTTLRFFSVLALLFLSARVQATTYFVLNLNDSGANSLRAAITSANADATATTSDPHIIAFDIFGGGTIDLATNLPVLNNHIRINGQAEQIKISGGTGVRGFEINSGKTVTIHHLVISDANLTNEFGGGIKNQGTLTLTYCTIKSNTIFGTGQGAGISNSNTGSIEMSNCTVSGNTSSNTGGGIVNYGSLGMVNCTVADNSGNDGGGIMAYNDLFLYNCTVTNNTGGGIYFVVGTGDIALANTISVGSVTGSDLSLDAAGMVISANGIYGTKTATATLTGVANVTGATKSAVFGNNVLANNGGSTQTVALISGSPAVDAGGTYEGVPALDQRGESRSGAVDIGAFEYQPIPTGTLTKLADDLVTVYSNPGNGLFNIEIGAGIQGTYDVKVVDMKGKLLFSSGSIQKGDSAEMLQINLSSQTQGNYSLIVTTEKGIVNKSLIKL